MREVGEYDEEEFGASGRKKRLAALAKKFQNYDEDEEAGRQVLIINLEGFQNVLLGFF